MNDLPFYPRCPATVAKERPHLTRDQFGGLDLLIDACWTFGGKLPDDDAQLAQITRCRDDEEWRQLRKVLAPFFRIFGGFWRHLTTIQNMERASKLRDARSVGGKKTAGKRWKHKKKIDHSSASSSAYSPAVAEHVAEHVAERIAGQPVIIESESDIERREEASPTGEAKKIARLVGEPAPRVSPTSSEKQNEAGRGERLPLDWQPDDEDCRYARERGLDPAEQAEAFRDFWAAKVGPNAKKLDWRATWRTWCRREIDSRHRRGSGSQRSTSDRPGITSYTAALRRVFPDVN